MPMVYPEGSCRTEPSKTKMQGKKKYMTAEHGKSLEWMKQVKALFDPNGILNPGKIFP